MLFVAIDIGGTAIKYGVVSNTGEILERNQQLNKAKCLEDLIGSLRKVIDGYRCRYTLDGIALTIPAVTNGVTGEILSEGSMPFLMGLNIKEALKTYYSMPIHSENDGNCAALGELWLGAGRDKKDVVAVVIGTGVGGAVIKDGRVHPGSHYMSGEFGYMIKQFDFDKGSFDTWSDVGGLGAIADKMSALEGRLLSGKDVFDLAERNHVKAIKYIDDFFNSNAIALFNIQYMYDPEVIIIGGKVSERTDFLHRIEKKLDCIFESIKNATTRPNLRRTAFGNESNLIGAVYHYMQQENLIKG